MLVGEIDIEAPNAGAVTRTKNKPDKTQKNSVMRVVRGELYMGKVLLNRSEVDRSEEGMRDTQRFANLICSYLENLNKVKHLQAGTALRRHV